MGFTVNYTNALKIGIPAPFGQIVSVAHPVTINRTLIADLAALRHGKYLNDLSADQYNTGVPNGSDSNIGAAGWAANKDAWVNGTMAVIL